MNRFHVIGGKNHGKTTLVAELVTHLSQLGYNVGTIKHTHHAHELDVPGKDSHRHRTAGATMVGILSRELSAAFWSSPSTDSDASTTDRYAEFGPLFSKCDLVLVEGDSQTDAAKIEVWRAELGSVPLATRDRSIAALVTDDTIELDVPKFRRSDLPGLGKKICQLFGLGAG